MTDSHITSPRSSSELRKFAFSVGPAFIVVFGLLLPWLLNTSWPLWPWIVAIVLGVWGYVHPASLQPVYRGWMLLGLVLHRIISPVVLGLMFYLLITPISLLLRVFGKKLINTGFDKSISTYRHPASAVKHDNYERPF